MSSPCHVELILAEREQAVKAEAVSVSRGAGGWAGRGWRAPLGRVAVAVCSAVQPAHARNATPSSPPTPAGAAQTQDDKRRKLSKKELAKKLRSGTTSKSS